MHSFNHASQLNTAELTSHLQYNISPHKNAPLSAAVESDVVGYTTIEMEGGKWYQIGNPFVELDDDATPTLGTVFNSGFSTGDQAYIYDSNLSRYQMVFTWSDEIGGWVDFLGMPADCELPVGHSVYFRKDTTGDVVLKGRVSATEVVSFPGSALSQVVCVYPTQKTINDMQWEGLAVGDQAYVYNASTQSYGMVLTWNGSAWVDFLGNKDTQLLDSCQSIFINKSSVGNGTLAAPRAPAN